MKKSHRGTHPSRHGHSAGVARSGAPGGAQRLASTDGVHQHRPRSWHDADELLTRNTVARHPLRRAPWLGSILRRLPLLVHTGVLMQSDRMLKRVQMQGARSSEE